MGVQPCLGASKGAWHRGGCHIKACKHQGGRGFIMLAAVVRAATAPVAHHQYLWLLFTATF